MTISDIDAPSARYFTRILELLVVKWELDFLDSGNLTTIFCGFLLALSLYVGVVA